MKPPSDDAMSGELASQAIKQAGIDPELVNNLKALSDVSQSHQAASNVKPVSLAAASVTPLTEQTPQQARVLQMLEQGASHEEAAAVLGVTERTIRRVVERYSGSPDVLRMQKAVGVKHARIAILALEEIERRFEEPNTLKGMRTGELSVISGISTDKMNAILAKPSPGIQPDWSTMDVPALVQDVPNIEKVD